MPNARPARQDAHSSARTAAALSARSRSWSPVPDGTAVPVRAAADTAGSQEAISPMPSSADRLVSGSAAGAYSASTQCASAFIPLTPASAAGISVSSAGS